MLKYVREREVLQMKNVKYLILTAMVAMSMLAMTVSAFATGDPW
jgi:hypothetical protein